MKAEKSTTKPAHTPASATPSTNRHGEGQCSPTPTTNQPGGRRGQPCPEGYPEVQPTDVPDAAAQQTPKGKDKKTGKPTTV